MKDIIELLSCFCSTGLRCGNAGILPGSDALRVLFSSASFFVGDMVPALKLYVASERDLLWWEELMHFSTIAGDS